MSDLIIGLVRHAESLWVQEASRASVRCFGGRMDDIGLSPDGVRQAISHGSYMRQMDLWPVDIYSSVARRAQCTATLAWGLKPILMSGLHELDWGEWERQPRTIARSPQHREAYDRLGLDFVPPGGESPNMVLQRATEAIRLIRLMQLRQNRLGLVLVYAHNSVIKTLVGRALDWSAEQFEQERLTVVSLTTFRVDQDGSLQLLRHNRPTI